MSIPVKTTHRAIVLSTDLRQSHGSPAPWQSQSGDRSPQLYLYNKTLFPSARDSASLSRATEYLGVLQGRDPQSRFRYLILVQLHLIIAHPTDNISVVMRLSSCVGCKQAALSVLGRLV